MDSSPASITQAVGHTLKAIRLARGLTLDQVARLTGVSKPLLSQLERGETNPTVITLWKIAQGLGVPFAQLLESLESRTDVRWETEHPTLSDQHGRYHVTRVARLDHPTPVELYRCVLAGSTRQPAVAHGPGVTEAIWVMTGRLTVEVGDQSYQLDTNHSLVFLADRPHNYQNPSSEPVTYIVVESYPAST
ncbi:transcriptional regulator, XRE family [Sulfobacillus acidophilus TPY]|uniref:Transcriptional regulator, XRE family with cupin sensor n=1 Tax=Sulfobacillus acidophilus (strain ATCC 700253 / DSM 10332 / NAL) TaxID=679936 RepID=G8TTY3_SULAD|nr:transcriptional regulator, XRE family [Sulfobacillus acidophilus TPY]AEW04574.1 transcriptional regulator, XRE family with cupin sensor [Sulfobacillus acidophilus DSM 10332]